MGSATYEVIRWEAEESFHAQTTIDRNIIAVMDGWADGTKVNYDDNQKSPIHPSHLTHPS